MAFGVRNGLCFCSFFLLTFLLLCSVTARNPIFFTKTDHEDSSMLGRSLKVDLEDYGEPTANRGHDPAWKRARGGGHVGRKG
ncbi:hypothetical protein Lal_00016978 [Lupinus albus]|uniref:Uncharacterized protein n=1 Tax=Lupinus albus TaxID=3870 RepID=A0A6A5P271_LUPAL|nr:putative protein PSY [Lupinus albus]KAF1891347.1 hypothetical protein Lal_00016978 [Lupinus albus]